MTTITGTTITEDLGDAVLAVRAEGERKARGSSKTTSSLLDIRWWWMRRWREGESKREESGGTASFWVGESMSSRKWVWQWGQRSGEGEEEEERATLMSHSWHQ